jgi:protein KTI12
VLSTNENSQQRNSLRENAYDLNTLNELTSRYEEPNNQTKWDSPLFSVDPDHVPDEFFDQIGQALCTDKIKRPPTFATSSMVSFKISNA